jgi:SNF2 family DNA or RNA helicase
MYNLFYKYGAEKAKKELHGLSTPLKPHQQRVVTKMLRADQPGLVVAHGLGSGKTLTSIAVQDALGTPADVIVPAALQENYRKERQTHLQGTNPAAHIATLQRVARQGSTGNSPLLVVDEAHRVRESGGKALQALKVSPAKKRLLLTGSPFYNRPSDISSLVNIAAGGNALPGDPAEFKRRYISEESISPGLWGTIIGVQPGVTEKPNPRQIANLKKILNKWVDYEPSSTVDFPSVTRQSISVPMGNRQRELYDAVMGKAPAWVRYKVNRGLPPSKQESQQLNAFSTAVRQISNSTRAYSPGAAPQETKIEAAFTRLKKELESNKRSKAIVYSNYLESGITPYRERLTQAGIPFGEYTGEMNRKSRDQLVRDYNAGMKRVMLLSSAGGEGLDLKGTRLVQLLEPHWNNEKLRQVEGRAIRYKSHADLPENERNVRVESYMATKPIQGLLEKMHISKPGGGIDEYLRQMSNSKDQLNNQFRYLLRQENV